MTSISDLSPAQFSDALKAWNDAVKEDAVFSQTDSASFQVGVEKAILADYHGGGMGLCYWDFRAAFSKLAFPWVDSIREAVFAVGPDDRASEEEIDGRWEAANHLLTD